MTNAPVATPGTVESVSVEWIIQNIYNTVEFNLESADGWLAMFLNKAYDDSFGPLVERILEDGFVVPVCLYNSGDGGCDHCSCCDPCPDDDSCPPFHANGEWQLGNGHHRMTAAVLLCLDTILVYWAPTSDYMQSDVTDPDEHDTLDSCEDWGIAEMLV